jgi:hypothetical protein
MGAPQSKHRQAKAKIMKTENGLPELTHLQFLVLEIVGSSTVSGPELRERLKKEAGIKKDGPAFYQLMARLEEAKLLRGWYEQEVIDGQIFKERHYQLLGNGINALKQTRRFYQRFLESSPLGTPKYVPI